MIPPEPPSEPLRRPPLSRQRVLETALRLVDEHGLESLSMRRLGSALGVEAMSLYRYVKGKGDLLDGLHGTILAEAGPLAPEGAGWEETLRASAHSLRHALARHPKAIPLFATRPFRSPEALEPVEKVLAVLREAGFGLAELVWIVDALAVFVIGHALAEHGARDEEASETPAPATMDPARFPVLREVLAAGGAHDHEAEFTFGLETFLLGLAARRGPGKSGIRPPGR